jgi:hypothetical protein
MQKHISSSLTAMGCAAVLVLPSAYAAQARDRGDRAERSEISASQSIDRADARIAILKADLRLTADQAKNWSGFETALHDVATKRAKALTDARDSQSGRSASDAATAAPAASEDADIAARRERDARANPQQDDITALQRESDALAAQSAALKQIADAAKPLYDSLDDRQRQRLVQFVNEDVRASQAEDWRALRR